LQTNDWAYRPIEEVSMITGAHVVIFTKDAEGLRSFFLEVLGFPSVDAGGGWLIFALPPAELAAHPTDEKGHHELYLMCDDVHTTVADLKDKGVELSRRVSDEGFGLVAFIELPGGEELGLYEPKHPRPINADPLS
jgi:catechol 2,3-dioxygenase-like lactoylglutathione lyase family enzyme